MEVDDDNANEEEEEDENEDNEDDDGEEKKVKITTVQQFTNFALPRKNFKVILSANPTSSWELKKEDDEGKGINDILLREKNKRLKKEKKTIEELRTYKKEIFDLEFQEQTKSDDIKDGDYMCPKCSSRKVTWLSVQLKSSDEPMDIVYKCHNKTCGIEGKHFKKVR
jgi:DNA-directed RNA polymerase subunit M/transcription elongation factor TFIIS